MRLKTFVFFVIGLILFQACNEDTLIVQPREIPSLSKQSSDQNSAKRYIVILNETVFDIPGVANEIAREKVELVFKNTVRGFVSVLPLQVAEKLKNDKRVKYIEEDRAVILKPPTDKPGKTNPDPEPEPGNQVIPDGIVRIGGFTEVSNKTAWILDTGVDLDHPDLNVDVSRSANFVSRGKNSADDGHGHGTHVAGIIAALNNNIDVVGVAAGASVVGIRVLDNNGSGYYSWIIAGVDYVAANASAGDVANMSLGGPASQALDDAVYAAAEKGIKFALAAGNESTNAGTRSPARVNHPNVYTISAMNFSDNFAYFSNYGNPPVDYALPGVGILSLKKGGGTTIMSGTSMAAPHMAGLLLLPSFTTDGFVTNDPDGNPDPIAHK